MTDPATPAVDTGPAAIAAWGQQYLADLLDLPVTAIGRDTDLDALGVDSALAVSLLVEIEERYGIDLDPEVLYEHPTLQAVAVHVHGVLTGS